jgi:hypothetical protein
MSRLPFDGEFHHYQLVDPQGNMPVSISVLVHHAGATPSASQGKKPLTIEDALAFHDSISSSTDLTHELTTHESQSRTRRRTPRGKHQTEHEGTPR